MLRTFTLSLLLLVPSVGLAQTVESIDAAPAPLMIRPPDGFAGAAEHSVELTTPRFKDLAPTLAITYSSSSKNGWLGLGMRLEGLSRIERVSANLGAPHYDATDLYLLDGERLLPCRAGSTAPSCTSGGSFTTRHEQFSRIARVGTTWTITSPSGVVSTYTELAAPVAVLTRRADPFGNAVTFTYAVQSGVTYPATISYNGTTITFYRASRFDVVTQGTGAGISRMDQRLTSVAVRTGAALERAYALTYATTTSSALSQLTQVREYGADATVSTAGAVSGGTAMPATRFTYNASPSTLTSSTYGTVTVPVGVTTFYDDSRLADVDGDGRADAIAISAETQGGTSVRGEFGIQVRRGLGNGSFSSSPTRTTYTGNAWAEAFDQVQTGDVNGDGRADLVFVRADTTYGSSPTGFIEVQVALGSASGTFSFQPIARLSSDTYSGEYSDMALGDLNGDGRVDLVLVRLERLGSGFYRLATAYVSLSAGTRYVSATKHTLANLDDRTSWATMRVHVGDVDGDRLEDIVIVQRGASLCRTAGSPDRAWARTSRSAGNGTFLPSKTTTLTSSCADSYTGDALVDVNADGRADLVGDYAASVYGAVCTDCDSDLDIVTNLSNGDGTFGAQTSTIAWTGRNTWIGRYTATFADVDGDGSADRVATRIVNGDVNVMINYSRGDGRFMQTSGPQLLATSAPTWWQDNSTAALLIGDLDGDGRAEPVVSFIDLSEVWHLVGFRAPASAGLLFDVVVPTGGTIRYAYQSSATGANAYLPFTFPVMATRTLFDGRGASATTRFAYSGGAYVPAERRFLGFLTARSIDPTGAYKDTVYTQQLGDPDRTVASETERTSGGALMRYSTLTYTRSGDGATAPFVSRPHVRTLFECNGDATCKARATEWRFNVYGALTAEIEHGDTAVTGDERTTFHSQVPNTAAFLTQLDSVVAVRAGAGVATGTLLQRTGYAYDGAAAGVAPTKGANTLLTQWDGTAHRATRMTYNAAGDLLTTTDPVNATTTWSYNGRHRVVRTVNPVGHVELRSYDVLGRQITTTDANGLVTTYAYDALGRLVRRATPDGGVATAKFVSWGAPSGQYVETAIADGTADALWTRTYLDGLGRKVRVLAEGGIITDTTYNSRGLLERTSAPYLTGATPLWTTTSYDAIGRPVRVQSADNAAVITSYGDWLVRTTDELGHVTDRTNDAYGQTVRVVERAVTNQVTSIRYDLLGRRVRVADALGNVTTTAYDALGRKTQESDPDRGLWRYVYDAAGRLIRQTDARGVVLDLTYDAAGRLLTRSRGAAVLAAFTYDEVAAGYANIGRLTSFSDASGSTQRDYDALGRLRLEDKTIAGATYRLDWVYDQAGRLKTVRYPNVGGTREAMTYQYDAAGRVRAAGPYAPTAAYDARGNATSVTYGNGNVATRTYSAQRGWLLTQTLASSTGVQRDRFTLVRDLAGNVTSRTSSMAGDSWLYQYDTLGRLTSADNTTDNTRDETFSYDALGNRTSAKLGAATTAYVYPTAGLARPHAPTKIGAAAVRYDANGNRLGIGSAPNAQYDANNRMTNDGTTAYFYDAEGTLVRVGTKHLVRDLFERDGATSMRFYLLGHERVARRDQAGTVAYYHADQLGSTRGLTNAAGGMAATRVLGAFGGVRASTGLADPFGLAGERLVGAYYIMGARWMDPVTGQFTQPDPSAAPDPTRPQTLHRYSYAYNNPIRITDPTGFQGENEVDEILSDPGDDVLRWKYRGGTEYQSTRVFSTKFYEEDRRATERGERTPAWAFESQTGRVFASVNADVGKAFETLDDAISFADQSVSDAVGAPRITPDYNDRGGPYFPQASPFYIEGVGGALYRYTPGAPGTRGALEPIKPSDVPSYVGGLNDALLIFNNFQPLS
ncbi:MAG: FG-GAP-like repeat-containing protein [Kofleriaceae bacterium]